MVWTLTAAGVPIQAKLQPLRSLRITSKGFGGSVANLTARLIDTTPYTLALAKEQVVICTDPSGVRAFGGYLRELVRGDYNTQGIRRWEITCQDFNTDLIDDYVPLGVHFGTGMTDKAIIQQLITTYSTRGLTAPNATVQQVWAGTFTEDFQFGGLTLYEAVKLVSDRTDGITPYVDYSQQVVYRYGALVAAPFNIDLQAPNAAATPPTRPARNFEYPDDSIDDVNEVLVIGAPGITATVYRGGSPPAAGTRRAVVHRDETILTVAQANLVGLAVLGGNTTRNEGSYDTWFGGLRGGMLQHVKNTQYGIDADFPLTQVEFVPLDTNQAFYHVTFGAAPISLGQVLQGHAEQISAAYSLAQDAAGVTLDAVPPGQVTGFSMASSYRQADDGTQFPNLTAFWNASPEADLDAYELEVARALTGTVVFTASASGTGGALPAGEYRIFVTGRGSVFGETAAQDAYATVTITAGQRLFVTITGKTGCSSYRVYAERVDNPHWAIDTATTAVPVEVTREGNPAVDPLAPTVSTATDFADPIPVRTSSVRVQLDTVQGGVVYIGRARAVDKSGNRGLFSTPASVQAQRDTAAPAIPTGFTAIAGKAVVGISWNRNAEPDLDRYEWRAAPDDGTGLAPDTTEWAGGSTRGTVQIVPDLQPDMLYWFEVRAVDTSGNVRTSIADATPLDADGNKEAGWTAAISAQPGLITGDDIAAGTILAYHLSAEGIDASQVTAGTLRLGGQPNTPDFLLVYNATGQEIGRWDANGIVIKDPVNPARQLRILNGVLSFSKNGGTTWTTAISGDGIVADSITLGSAPGGHNSVPNASFELSAFATRLTKLWTSAADWTASIVASDVNVNKATTELRMTTVTFP